MEDTLLKATVRELFTILALKETVRSPKNEKGEIIEKEVPVVSISVSRSALVPKLGAIMQLMATLASEQPEAAPAAPAASDAPADPAGQPSGTEGATA